MTSEIPEIMKSMMSSGPKSPRVARNPSRLTMKTAMPKPAITLAMICCLPKDTAAGTRKNDGCAGGVEGCYVYSWG